MTRAISDELTRLDEKSVPELLAVYREVFGRTSPSRHRQNLLRRIAWGLQCNGEYFLSKKALQRVAELVDPYDLRVSTATRIPGRVQETPRQPIPGTVICRTYKGEVLEVRVLEDGFEFAGQEFGSLSAVAKHITGSHWNGNLFFGTRSVSRREKNGG